MPRLAPGAIGGLAVGVIGEARTTGAVDVVGYVSTEDALALITKTSASGFEVRPEVERERLRATGTPRFGQGPFQLDVILALAEDMEPWRRLESVLRKAAGG